jgi:hypothetical protein
VPDAQQRPFWVKTIIIMPNQFVELHDSELAVLWFEHNEEAILIFSSLYVHESEGKPGIDDGTGWFQRAELVIEGAACEELDVKWPCSIFDGATEIDGVIKGNGFLLPLECKKSFKLYLETIDDGGNGDIKKLEIKGSGATLTFLGKKGPTEEFRA